MRSRLGDPLRVLQPVTRRAASGRDFGASEELHSRLRARVRGEVRFDAGSRALYATDGSNYRQVPIGVALPLDSGDVINTIATCREFGAPVLNRGGGTSLAGQCCNVAVVLDFTKYMHRVLEIDACGRRARVEPGVYLDTLRNAAERHGLTFGPDPSTHSHCTLGGMLGNNSCGVHSQQTGKTVDNTEEMEVLTYDGLRLRVGWMDQAQLEAGIREGGRKGAIFAGIRVLRDRYAALIRSRYQKIPRRVSGYNLDELLPDENGRFNLARALVGSEGTLVTILEATLRLVPSPPFRSLLVLGYPDIYTAADHVVDVLPALPFGLEAIDDLLVENMKTKGMHPESLEMLPEGKGWLLVEFGGTSKQEADEQARGVMRELQRSPSPPAMKLFDDPEHERKIWEVRESGLGATAFVPGQPVTWEGWEDSAVPPERMGDYLRELAKLYARYGYRGVMYGHFGQGCLHTRINFDLHSHKGVRNFRSFVEEAADLVVSYGGSLSGEHGDGQSRAELLEKMFGPELVQAFREFKAIWDPEGKMNPGKVVDAYRLDENLRFGGDYRPWQPHTNFAFPDDQGSLDHAVSRCVGVGKCRRLENAGDTMCPSYMVTREEMHSTRGRAHLLWEMLQGDPLTEGWRNEPVKAALDLCLACKGCKSDCPVNVDIATYKAEFLSHYWEGRLRPREAYLFGFIDRWARLGAIAPGLANLLTQLPAMRALARGVAAMPRQRRIPPLAAKTFKEWFFSRRPRNSGGARVLLWPDTFNNHFFPDTAAAAVEVLEAAGYKVVVPRAPLCCGRPLYDYGFLGTARRYLRRVLDDLSEELEAGTPVVALEPSCASVFRDELHNLLPDDERARRLGAQTHFFGEFLVAEGVPLPRLERAALLHCHCHHKSLGVPDRDQELLESMGMQVTMPDSGCCGMAGSFGFERDKYSVSIACAERVLLPAVRAEAPETIVVTDGFSCREQIAQQTERHALHLAEVIHMAMQHGPRGPGFSPAEADVIEQRSREVRGSMRNAGLALAAVGLVAAGMWYVRQH